MLTYLILIFSFGLIITAIILMDVRETAEQADVESLAPPGRGLSGGFARTRCRTNMS